MKVKIKSYSGELTYLTPEKEYEVISTADRFLTLKADNGAVIMCQFVQCYHLNSGSWEIVTESHTSHN